VRQTAQVDLDAALKQFDLTEANVSRLEVTWKEMRELIPDGIVFLAGTEEGAAYASLARDAAELAGSLPAISGETLKLELPDPDDVAQGRLDANEIGEPTTLVAVERWLSEPDDAISAYRHRLDRERRKLVRSRVLELLADVDVIVSELSARVPRDGTSLIEDEEWQRLASALAQAERLVGSSIERRGRWSDLRRHLSFAQGADVHDIAEHDWPSVRKDIESALYGQREPFPIEVTDLAALAAERPAGQASTGLDWDGLEDGQFERLVLALLAGSAGYENAQLLTHTNAPDRSRDVSADRVTVDTLSGTVRQRVIVQCKNWRSRSVALNDLTVAVAAMTLWEPPPVGVLVIATTGRFTTDAVAWIEKHNHDGARPRIEPWPDTRLELLLAEWPVLVSEFGLRT